MTRFTQQTNLVFATISITLSLISAAAMGDETVPTISVTGKAEVKVSPDEAVLSFSIRSEAATLDEAVSDNDAKIKSVMSYLNTSGVKARDTRTQVISIQPIYEQEDRRRPDVGSLPVPWDESKPRNIQPIGYRAQRQLSIVITDLAKFEGIYRGLIAQGVNTVGGVEFRTTRLRQYRDEARLQAVRAAKEKAAAMAGELGATLAGVVSIDEASIPSYGGSAMMQNRVVMGEFSGQADSVAAGMIEVNASVSVVFRLGNNDFGNDKNGADKNGADKNGADKNQPE